MLILRAWFLTLPTSCPLGFETTFRDVPLGQICSMPHAPVAWPQRHCVFPLGCWEDEMKSHISAHTNASWRLVPREHPTARRPSPVSNPHKAQSGACAAARPVPGTSSHSPILSRPTRCPAVQWRLYRHSLQQPPCSQSPFTLRCGPPALADCLCL